MRFGLESSSEVSADEEVDASVRFQQTISSPSVLEGESLPSTSTPRKGILRKTGPSAVIPTPISSKTFSVAPRAAHFYSDPSSSSYAQPTGQTSSERSAASKTPDRRINSTTNLFESVGLPTSSASFHLVSERSTESSKNPVSLPVPPWMRSQQPRTSRATATDLLDDDDVSDSSETDSRSSDEDPSSSPSTSSVENAISDSEEEEWPVEPGRVGMGDLRASKTAKSHSKRRKDLARRIRLASVADDWEDWDRLSRESALSRATSSYVRRLRSYSAAPEDHDPTGPVSPSQQRARPGSRFASRKSLNTNLTPAVDDDLDEVRKLLSTLTVKREDEERKEKAAFDARNRLLWQGIDASILAAEKEAEEAAAAEAQRLAAARKAQEEAERKARQERENEQKRIEAEKKASEEAEVKQKKAEEDRQKAEEEARKREEKEKAMEGGGTDIRDGAQREYERWIAKINHIKQNVLPAISQNPELRKQCFAAKRQITPKVGQLTNSQQEVVRITNAIGAVLESARSASPTGEIYTWILNHLSKCLIRQAEQEVAAKQDTAYPLARVVVWLLLQGHFELGEVLMARLAKKCCWCLAVWPPKRRDQDDDSYRKALGYRSSEESNENYSSRMAGIFAFYVAILQTTPTSPPSGSGGAPDLSLVPDYLRPRTLWTWSVRTLSSGSPVLSHPLLPSLWSTFLEVGGNRALGLYGKQMAKLWRLMLDEGIRGKKAGFVQKGEEEGYVKASIVRLQLLLEGWEKQGRIVDATKGVEMEQP